MERDRRCDIIAATGGITLILGSIKQRRLVQLPIGSLDKVVAQSYDAQFWFRAFGVDFQAGHATSREEGAAQGIHHVVPQTLVHDNCCYVIHRTDRLECRHDAWLIADKS